MPFPCGGKLFEHEALVIGKNDQVGSGTVIGQKFAMKASTQQDNEMARELATACTHKRTHTSIHMTR
jgi:hypothetical protein